MFTSAFYRSQAKATIGFTYDNSKSIGDSDKDDDDDDDSSDSDSDSILSDIGKCVATWYWLQLKEINKMLCCGIDILLVLRT